MPNPTQDAHYHSDQHIAARRDPGIGAQDSHHERQPNGAKQQADGAAQQTDAQTRSAGGDESRRRVRATRTIRLVGSSPAFRSGLALPPGQQGHGDTLPKDEAADQSDEEIFRRPAAE